MATPKFCDEDEINFARNASVKDIDAANKLVNDATEQLADLFDKWEERCKLLKFNTPQFIAFQLVDAAARVLIIEEGEGDSGGFGEQCIRIYEYAALRLREQKPIN